MIARDLMNSEFPYYVTVDVDPAYVAKLLSCCQAGAIHIVDERLSPIGIVTRSNFETGGDATSSDRANGRSLRDVMTPNPVSVDETAALAEILRLLEASKLKRIPVVNGERLVGVLLRKQVMDAARQAAGAFPSKPSTMTRRRNTAANFLPRISGSWSPHMNRRWKAKRRSGVKTHYNCASRGSKRWRRGGCRTLPGDKCWRVRATPPQQACANLCCFDFLPSCAAMAAEPSTRQIHTGPRLCAVNLPTFFGAGAMN